MMAEDPTSFFFCGGKVCYTMCVRVCGSHVTGTGWSTFHSVRGNMLILCAVLAQRSTGWPRNAWFAWARRKGGGKATVVAPFAKLAAGASCAKDRKGHRQSSPGLEKGSRALQFLFKTLSRAPGTRRPPGKSHVGCSTHVAPRNSQHAQHK
jgi:hypothetical protein